MPGLKLRQIDGLFDAPIGAIGFAASGSSNTVTTPITTVLSTAGNGGISVPLQVASTSQVGVITTGSDARVEIVDSSTKKKIADASSNEVYGRLSESSGAYTLSYFSLVAGSETAYTIPSTSIDFYFNYRYDLYRLPSNFAISLGARVVSNDPASVGGSTARWVTEKLTVTALNTLSALSNAPTVTTNIFLIVNGKTENAFGGGSAAFSVSGTTVSWSAANAGYPLETTYDVIAYYERG